MFKIINCIWNILGKSDTPSQIKKDEYDKIMEELDAIDLDNQDDGGNVHVESSYIPDAHFFRLDGKITHIYSDRGGRINDQFIFNADCVIGGGLEIGDTVVCMARKMAESIEIYKVEKLVIDRWEDEYVNNNNSSRSENITAHRPIALQTDSKWIKGIIESKSAGIVTIDTFGIIAKKIMIPLKEIGCTFIPKCGDQIDVDIEYEIEDINSSQISPIGFYSMRPADSKTITGKITRFNRNAAVGEVNQEYLFYADVLQHSDNRDSMPDKNDYVIAEVIRCDIEVNLKRYFWRCIYIVKDGRGNNIYNNNTMKNVLPMRGIEMALQETNDEIDNQFVTFTRNHDLKVSLEKTNDKQQIQLIAKNVSSEQRQISKCTYGNIIASSQISCEELEYQQIVQPGTKFIYNIQVIGKVCGTTKVKINFLIDDNAPAVSRCILIEVRKEADHNLMAVRQVRSKAYTKSVYKEKRDTVAGIRPVETPHFIDRRLERFEIPERLIDALTTENTYSEIDVKIHDIMDSMRTLQLANYCKFFNYLLFFEELHLRHEFRRYDCDRGHFQREGEYLAYKMPGNVFECRPSIVIGDMVFAQCLIQSNAADKNVQYQGFVHRIKRDRILLKFDEDFSSNYQGQDYGIIFKFSRSPFIKQHNGVSRLEKLAKDTPQLLFPDRIVTQKKCQFDVQLVNGELQFDHQKRPLKWCNPKLNQIQKRAILNILRGESRPMPYVIFGPPGTGKTSTLIEVILQLYRRGGTRLIIAAPSNSAANWITKLLIESRQLEDGEFTRIVSQNSIEREQIPPELHKHCMTCDIAAARSRPNEYKKSESGIQLQQNSQAISLHRILISTCSTFGSLLYMSFAPGHFTHVIIDEAGQCTEPEISIPISLLSKKDGQIILAGDPNQLGPVVLSPLAKRCGLEKSLLCRLLDRVPYKEDDDSKTFDDRLVTQLLNNYRSLPSILSSCSKLFYKGRLIANISPEGSNEHMILSKIQTRPRFMNHLVENFGTYFIGIQGKEEQTFDSTSWRNPQETLEVVDVVNELFQLKFTADDIGIITPYTLQVKDIRKLCSDIFDCDHPKVGSVEEFQGQERNIIIVSTVRSKDSSIAHDEKYGLGFINNSRRTNVTISRARAALIIIGNPLVLRHDHNWRHLISVCVANGTYKGFDVDLSI